MSDERKRDAREKITLGGLVTKAGLRHADKAFILGALMEAAKIAPADPAYERLRTIGDPALNAAGPS